MSGTFEVFFSAFIEDVAGYYCPFIPHVLGYWSRRGEKNILFLTYEEMKQDLPAVIRKVAGFLDKRMSDIEVSSLAEHLSFNKMKENKAVNKEDFEEISKWVIVIVGFPLFDCNFQAADGVQCGEVHEERRDRRLEKSSLSRPAGEND